MSCSKQYGDNFISARSSTRIHHQPGGKSSIGSLLFGGDNDESTKANKENRDGENRDTAVPVPVKASNIDGISDVRPESRVKGSNIDGISDVKQESKVKGSNIDGISDVKPESKVNDGIECTKCRCDSCKSDAEKVREFTSEAGQLCPDKPQLMDVDEVNFITKMIIDELLELYSTVLPPQSAKNAMKKMIDEAKSLPKMNVSPNYSHELIAEQGDALVDIYYYSLNSMAKKGVNLSKIFNLVHSANMAKRDQKTGKFLKRADGKIIKPSGWKAPDVGAEIKSQIKNGSWQ